MIVGRLVEKEAFMATFTPQEVRSMLIWGAVGGAMPTLSKLAGTFGTNFDAPTPRILGVAIAIGLYGVIGSIISRAIGNPDVKQALFAGIAAPAIVVGVISGASDSQSLHGAPKPNGASLFSPAYAQSPPAATATRPVAVTIQVQGNYPVAGVVQIAVKTDGRLKPVVSVPVTLNTTQATAQVPSGPTTLVFTSETGANTEVEIDNQSAVLVNIGPSTSITGDLKWALGSQRALDIGTLHAVAK
jgi:hypothetical protein